MELSFLTLVGEMIILHFGGKNVEGRPFET